MSNQKEEPKAGLSGQQIAAIAPGSAHGALLDAVVDLGAKLVFCERPTARQGNSAVVDFAHRVVTGGVDLVVFLSRAGVRRLLDVVAKSVDRQRFLNGLSDIGVLAANEQVAKTLRECGVEPRIVSERRSWRELLMFLDQNYSLANLNVAVEQFTDTRQISAGLESRGCAVIPIPIFENPDPDEAQQLAFEEMLASLRDDRFELILINDVADAHYFLCRAGQESLRSLSNWLAKPVVVVGGDEARTFLLSNKLHNDFCVLAADAEQSLAARIQSAYDAGRRNRIRYLPAGQNVASQAGKWDEGPFMKACRGEPTDVTPIWMMRQAGRYMQEYRDVRAGVSFLELCANPSLCSEVMCTAVEKLGVDAAIIFSDLLPILVPMGCDLEFTKGDGPVIHNPVREVSDLDRIQALESLDELEFVMETVRQTRKDLPEHLPLIGFAGAPFTLASYMIEGGASRNYANTKRLMHADQGAWHELMTRLADSISLYLNGQVSAGAQCLQLFDSWAGCLSYEDYRLFVLPYVKQIIDRIPFHVPVINFATGNPALLPLLADTRARVIGIDWRIRLDDAWQTVGFDRSVQGNLDPTILLTDPEYIRSTAKNVLEQAAGRDGHIFNLGHGILPMTPVENAIALVDAVHELSAK